MKYVRKTSKDITSNFLMELLKDRKILPELEKQAFFIPTEENELPAGLLDHIQGGYELLKKHIKNGSKIYLPVDPDVDGYTSAALFYNYFNNTNLYKEYNFEIEYRMPQGKEHGLRNVVSELELNKKYDLIVMLDSSSNDYEEHKVLSEIGYDILVIDHHEAEYYSENAIVINNQLSKNYSNKNLSGVGVTYKFLEFFEASWKNDLGITEDYFYGKDYLDLVALGEISDMMIMTDLENRYICEYGLSHIQNNFFQELVDKQSYSLGGPPLTQIGVAFYITPLINSLIRMGSDLEKERLFEAFINPNKIVPSTKRGEKGMTETVCTQSTRNCVNAKARQKREMDKAAEQLKIQIMQDNLDENKVIILNADELDIPNTLTGLCAMNISAEYKKPVMLGRISPDGFLKGSIRGRGESELKDFKGLLQNSHLMEFVEGRI